MKFVPPCEKGGEDLWNPENAEALRWVFNRWQQNKGAMEPKWVPLDYNHVCKIYARKMYESIIIFLVYFLILQTYILHPYISRTYILRTWIYVV